MQRIRASFPTVRFLTPCTLNNLSMDLSSVNFLQQRQLNKPHLQNPRRSWIRSLNLWWTTGFLFSFRSLSIFMINLSFRNGLMPTLFKEAVLNPIIMKDSLDHEIYQKCRPISNRRYGEGSSFSPHFSACYTVDRQVLLTRVKCYYGVKGNSLAWMAHISQIGSKNGCSSKHKLACGVPQRSVLGPTLNSIYMALIANAIQHHEMVYHFCANDTHIYVSSNPADSSRSKSSIERCIQDVQQWMVVNRLKLNGDKTQLLVLTACYRPPPPLDSILIRTDVIKTAKSAKNTGVSLDSVLAIDIQVNNICKIAFFLHRNNS